MIDKFDYIDQGMKHNRNTNTQEAFFVA